MHYTCRDLLLLTPTHFDNDPERSVKTFFKSIRAVQATFLKGVTVVDPNDVGGRNIIQPIGPHRHSCEASSPAAVSAVRVCALWQPVEPGCFDAHVQTYVLGVAQTIHRARGKQTGQHAGSAASMQSYSEKETGGDRFASKVVAPI